MFAVSVARLAGGGFRRCRQGAGWAGGGGGGWRLWPWRSGRVDAYYERGINYWDRAAGGLVATEAGAHIGGLPGEPAGSELTIAAGSGLFTELQQMLAALSQRQDSATAG